MTRRFLIVVIAAVLLCAFIRGGGGPVVRPTSIPAWQQSGQTFYPNVPALGTNDSSNIYNATRSVMVNGPCALSAIKVVYTNSAVNGSNHGENTSANEQTSSVPLSTGVYDAMIEYPLGTTPQQITFSASDTVSIAAAIARTISDSYTIAIPANALYAIQTLSYNSNTSNSIGGYESKGVNNPLPHYSASNSTSAVVTTTSNTAPTQFGTAGNWTGTTTGAISVGPLEVLGQVATTGCSQHAVLAKGDSWTVGQTDGGSTDTGDTHGFVGMIMRMLDEFTNIPPFICACIGTNQVDSYSAPIDGSGVVENQMMQDVTNLIIHDVGNNVNTNSGTPATENYLSRMVDDLFAVGGKFAAVFPPPMRTSSADTWTTYANQTPFNAQWTSGGMVTTLSTWITSGVTNGGNAFIDLDYVDGNNSISGTANITGCAGGTRYLFVADCSHTDGSTYGGEHPTSTGGITKMTSRGIAWGNSYAVGADAGYVILNPSSTAYGLLQ